MNRSCNFILPTGIQRMSDWSCMRTLLLVIPPSTCNWLSGTPQSLFMASKSLSKSNICYYLIAEKSMTLSECKILIIQYLLKGVKQITPLPYISKGQKEVVMIQLCLMYSKCILCITEILMHDVSPLILHIYPMCCLYGLRRKTLTKS